MLRAEGKSIERSSSMEHTTPICITTYYQQANKALPVSQKAFTALTNC